MLAADVVVYGDGGGKAPSWPRPIYGRERVAKLIAGDAQPGEGSRGHASSGAASTDSRASCSFDDEDRIGGVMSVDVADGLVQTIRGVTNPDKLEHLGPVADTREVLRKNRR